MGPAIKPGFRIVILGGGAAGWMTACLMAKRWAPSGVSISVVESPEIGIIGVGEGSTPQLKAFFRDLGVSENEWMPRCNATYKNGISFHGWSQRPGCERYFHPFPSPIDAHTAPAFHFNSFGRRRGIDLVAAPGRFFLSAKLAEKRLAPIAAHNFPFEIAYGYHFDAHLAGAFLRRHAEGRGVRHIEGKVTGIALDARGAVASLTREDGDLIEADFFVDSTGFRSMILQERLGVPFHSYKENLFNDSAVVMPTPPDKDGLNSETRAIAMNAGWRWDIPLTNRSGNGYVYSSDFISAEAAERELRTALGLLDADAPARHLKMKVGRVDRHWEKNCLAVGLAQGFIEPLEATALHLVQATIEGFIETFEKTGFEDAGRRRFNERINARFEGVRDYIVCHYQASFRDDAEYWRANAANSKRSPSLQSMMNCWRAGSDIREEVRRQDIGKYYTDMSWTCLLGGYGDYPRELRAPAPEERRFDMGVIDDFIERASLNFPDHRAALSSLQAAE